MKTNLDSLDLLYYYIKSMIAHVVAVISCGFIIPSSENPSVILLIATTVLYILAHAMIMFLFFRKDIPNHYRRDQDSIYWLCTAVMYILPGEMFRLFLSCIPLIGSYFSMATIFVPTPTLGVWLKLFPDVIENNSIGSLTQIPLRLGCYILIHFIYMIITVAVLQVIYRLLWNLQDNKTKQEVRLTMDSNQMK